MNFAKIFEKFGNHLRFWACFINDLFAEEESNQFLQYC